MSKEKQHHLEPYFYNNGRLDGIYDIPVIKKQNVDLTGLKLVRFSAIVKNETDDTDATVHFFEYDDRFDEVWQAPAAYISEIRQYKQTMTPDFSLYANMPLALQIFNTYRTRWIGAYWQGNGLTVIPTVSWSDEWSYDFCFDGIDSGSVTAVSTLGCKDAKDLFMSGFARMCQTIDPEAVICYAEPFAEMYNYVDIIEVPYMRNERVACAKSGEAK
jgi:hypothetical protein